jgi:hypothetical protein
VPEGEILAEFFGEQLDEVRRKRHLLKELKVFLGLIRGRASILTRLATFVVREGDGRGFAAWFRDNLPTHISAFLLLNDHEFYDEWEVDDGRGLWGVDDDYTRGCLRRINGQAVSVGFFSRKENPEFWADRPTLDTPYAIVLTDMTDEDYTVYETLD